MAIIPLYPGGVQQHSQPAGLLGLPKLLRKRSAVQAARRVSDEYLLGVLTPVD